MSPQCPRPKSPRPQRAKPGTVIDTVGKAKPRGRRGDERLGAERQGRGRGACGQTRTEPDRSTRYPVRLHSLGVRARPLMPQAIRLGGETYWEARTLTL